MKTKTTKTTKNDKQTKNPLDIAGAKAAQLEDSGRWREAAAAWEKLTRIGSKQQRAEAAGRAAAAKVRADATPADETAPTANDARDVAPVDPPSTDNATIAADAPTIEPGANDADAPAKDREPAADTGTAKPRERDSRLPPVGTTIQKRDRNGQLRCECAVTESGILYNRTTYKSLSAAAMAAAKDLGLANKSLNGYAFWGLATPKRPAADVLESLARAWERYCERAHAALNNTSDDDRSKVQTAVKEHVASLLSMTGQAQ